MESKPNCIPPADHGQRRRIDESVNYPGQLDETVTAWLAANSGDAQAASAALQESYRKGQASKANDLAAYLTVRLPATFAANQRVMADIANIIPGFTPRSLLDVGAGPGTASWAALTQWPDLLDVSQIEVLMAFCRLAELLNHSSGLDALRTAKVIQSDINRLPDVSADIVVASYVLAEQHAAAAPQLALKMWSHAKALLVLIEPGTPQGFARIRAARETLRGSGHIIAPCTHANACPMENNDWCHFKTRLARSRAHMHAKSATVPFEDEAFSYLAIARDPPNIRGARIIAPTSSGKVSAELKLCDASGVHTVSIASRNKPAYKHAKKARWGDLWSVDT